jgi:hypothetical protein
MAKWNEGLRIEESLGVHAGFSNQRLFAWLHKA